GFPRSRAVGDREGTSSRRQDLSPAIPRARHHWEPQGARLSASREQGVRTNGVNRPVEFLMKSRFLHTRSAGAAILVLLTAATAASAFISPLRQPPIYTIQGYLDRAPAGTTVIDRIQVAATGRPPRWLLVTVYRSPGDLPP